MPATEAAREPELDPELDPELEDDVLEDDDLEDDDLEDDLDFDRAYDEGAVEDDPRVPGLFRSHCAFAILMLVCGAIGLVASSMLTLEYLHKLTAPEEQLLCDLNPFITCGPAMLSTAGHVLGIPNIIVGLFCFSVVVTTAMAMLAGARMRRWYWIGMQLGVLFAACLISYLQWFSVFELARLCLWCMIIWSITIPLTVAVTVWNMVRGHLGEGLRSFGRMIADFWWAIAVVWALCVVGMILIGMWQTIQLSFL